ncbi:ABC transporter permease [Microbacterium mangrovi]|uniref:ABC transporter permease n=1 Tax=Microbacterium mangrovi TaxID=1348253 RepID=UPI0009E016A1|nr:ABC transporter permease [Microbacterium mangrovi]
MIDPAPRTETVAIGTIDEPNAPWWKKIFGAQAFQIFLILLVIIAVFAVLAPSTFAQWSNFRLIMQNASILAVLGVGMTFVIVTAGIDLSIGSVLVFSGVVSAMVMRSMGGQGWGTAIVGIVVAIICGIFWGWVNGVLVAKAKIPPLIVTLGTFGATLGFAQILTGGVDISAVPLVLTTSIGYGNVFGSLPVIVVIAAVVVVIGAIMLAYTKFGLYTRAVGSSEEAARRVGVKVDRQLIYVYTMTGALAGFAGILSLSQFATTAIAGQSLTNLNVIAAVVIGGTSLFGGYGTIIGTVVGLFIPAVLQNGFVITGVQPYWQQVAVGAVLIVAVYADQLRRSAAARGASGGLWKKLLFRRTGS